MRSCMKILSVLVSSVVLVSPCAAGDKGLFMVYARCDGVLQGAFSSSGRANSSPSSYSMVSDYLKKAALLVDSSKGVSDYYAYKVEGLKKFEANKENELERSGMTSFCAQLAQDAMIFVDTRRQQ